MSNPQAFPHVEPRDPQFSSGQPGMTLRDWFAGQALAGLCANHGTLDQLIGLGFTGSKDLLAECAYAHADAMLAERERTA